jgi:endo-1,4-beta-xylanase
MKKYLSIGMLALAIQANAAGLVYDFESNSDDWFGRGDGEISLSTEQKHEGQQSLFVSNRAANWHGAALSNDYIEPGKKYKFSVFVFVKENANMNLSLQYSEDGNDSYPCVSQKEVYAYSWTELSGEIILPDGATNIQPYLQSNNETLSFYIDDFSCEEVVEEIVEHNEASLWKAFNNYFKIGTATTQQEIAPLNNKNLILHHFNSVTPGNELKPDCLLDQNASIANGNNVNPQVKIPASTRSVLKFCEQNNLPIRGHVFVWHSQTPDWFFNEGFETNGATVSKEIMDQRMENYIKNVVDTIVAEFPNLNIYAWDVVNEAFSENGGMRQPGSNYVNDGASRWMEVYGDNSFIYKAFTYAKKYVPEGCKLYYNDYNEYIESKRDGIYNLVKDLHEKNLCDGVGMQSHLSTSYPSVQLYRAAVEKYASIGCDIQVTELDITLADGADFSKQAQMYKDLFDIYREYKDYISLVAVWGTNDETSWRSDGKPLIFSGYKPKEAYAKIIDGMDISTGAKQAAATEECLMCSDNNSQTVVFCRAGFFSYEITDISGRTCLSGSGNGFVNLNISRLPDGVYLAVVKTSDGKIFKEKIVKK